MGSGIIQSGMTVLLRGGKEEGYFSPEREECNNYGITLVHLQRLHCAAAGISPQAAAGGCEVWRGGEAKRG